ncbi:MAG: FadR family transcriptional regulator [Acidobacterium ailaaui]|nr:FadR family transcriptional regulator [Pseudacidobacterium ailaaui]
MADLIDSFQAIKIEKPVDKIIRQIKHLIASGQLKPGDKLPPERVLAERMGVGRSYVRDAIRKLEFYGLVKTYPQNGTYISNYNIGILEGLLIDVINLNTDDFASLIEVRYYLEIMIASLAAERRTEEDIQEMRNALDAYERKVVNGESAVEEDLFFHLKIVHATGNPVFESIMLILLPDLIRYIVEKRICEDGRSQRALLEHKKILKAIEDKSSSQAGRAMAEHLNEIMQISQNERENSSKK